MRENGASNIPIIVFSHLRWDFVYQRPQHILSRLARKRKVIFFEEPVIQKGITPKLDRTQPSPGVTVYRPYLPSGNLPFGDEQFTMLAPLLRSIVEKEALQDYIVWLYTPMALRLARLLEPVALVYDCMDALAAFKDAPPMLLEREAQLMELADVVFTGGPSLYKAKLGRHPNLHCFSSSVDVEHFAGARSTPEATDQRPIPRPRLGYYGVIDERMDLELLAAVASSHPEWQIIMVGPVVKIDAKSLPRKKNIHYLGQRSYQELPSYLAGWDVCLLPFALNESTRYISPTKTVEYMAAGLPIVSTPITDVVEPYGDIVHIASGTAEFVQSCERAISEATSEKALASLQRAYERVLAQTSWDRTVEAMAGLIDEAVTSNAPKDEARADNLLQAPK